ncbi:MAG: DegV family protein [Dehalogenimonas sp.]
MPVRIVTDSTADLPEELVTQFDITVVPQIIRLGNSVYREGIDISRNEFYDKLINGDISPNTSQPSPQQFVEVYQQNESEAQDGILSIHVSKKLSGTYDSALQGAKLAQIKCPLEIVDTQSASMGLGLLVLLAASMAKKGMRLGEIADEIRKRSKDIRLLGFFDTLKYCAAGGRIGKVKAFIGSVLNVKPLVTLREGELYPIGQVRSRTKGFQRLMEFLREGKPESLVVIHSTTPDEARTMAKYVTGVHPGKPVIVSQFSAAVGSHTGPGTLFVGFLNQPS